MRTLACLALLGLIVSGCKSSSEKKPAAEGKKETKRAPKLATLYVEGKGEPVNAGGRKVEKSDQAGNSKGSFGAKDLLVPGMYLLVSGVTTAGGALLVRALDKKDRPDGPTYVASGGSEGTYMSVDTPPAGDVAPAEAPDPGKFAATGTDGGPESTEVAGAGSGVVATPSSVIVSMGYTTGFTGPSYVKVKSVFEGPWTEYGHMMYLYQWELTLDRSMVESGTVVNVYGSFSGLPAGKIVMIWMVLPDGTDFTVDHAPLVSTIGPEGLGSAWYYSTWSAYYVPTDKKQLVHSIALPAPPDTSPVKLGHLTVVTALEITADSTAEVTVR